MAWQSLSGIGSNNGNGGGDGGQQGNQPQGTEYTLQGKISNASFLRGGLLTETGVMRFLQTEWHRHERDRNAWEIEKQEMKARIAALEGAARRSDATQKALKKYVTILEKKVKEQSIQLKGGKPDESQKTKEEQREAQLKEHLRCKSR